MRRALHAPGRPLPPLRRESRDGVHLDVCRACRGAWFDHHELASVWSLHAATALARRPAAARLAGGAGDAAGNVLPDVLWYSPELAFYGAHAAGHAVAGAARAASHLPEAAGGVFEVVVGILEGLFSAIDFQGRVGLPRFVPASLAAGPLAPGTSRPHRVLHPLTVPRTGTAYHSRPMDSSTWINPHIPPDPRFQAVGVTEEEIIAKLRDGRKVTLPLAWSERLSAATREQRHNVVLLDEGELAHWPDVGEFLSAQGVLYGTKARLLRRQA